MNLTLGVLASVLALLPGLALIAAFNLTTRRGGARRPEMQLTAISALVLAVFFSTLAHLFTYLVTDTVLAFLQALSIRFHTSAGPVIRNPLGAGFEALGGRALPVREGLWLLGVLTAEIILVANLTMSRGFRLLIDNIDYNGQGWVFEHITRPAENGYTPVGHVYTSTMSGRFGIAYKGAVTDIRQDEKGQVLSIALSRPERFLYEIGPEAGTTAPTRRRWFKRDRTEARPAERDADVGIRHHGKESAGGVVSLDARVINNIVVHCIANSLLQEIDTNLSDPPTGDGE